MAAGAAEEVDANRVREKEGRDLGDEVDVHADRIAMLEFRVMGPVRRHRPRRRVKERLSGLPWKLGKALMMAKSASSVPRESNTLLSPPATTGPAISVP